MPISFVIQMVAVMAIFYFLFILPQRKEQKRHRELLAALKPGDEVVTVGGVIGDVVQIKDDQVLLKSAESRLVVEKVKIIRRTSDPAPRV
jgi:preprotein translocase subunit YajC